MRRKVIINWGVSSYYGWGVYGLNLALAWAKDPEIALLCARPVTPGDLAVDAVRMQSLQPFLFESARLVRQLGDWKGRETTAQNPLLTALQSGFRVPAPEGVQLLGSPTIGVTFFETAVLEPDALERAREFPMIVAGSTWNETVLRAHGLQRVTTILQGVDHSLFHPAPGGGPQDRFLVFSGGKLEQRKGQDIALVAFRRFAERHPDALLVAAWHSPFSGSADSIDASALTCPVVRHPDGQLNASGWAAANGVRPENFLDAGRTPNALMPQLYRQMDVALFPNRCEGGTNLVAMECMACGVPTILSANTGHLDLIGDDNCYVLTRQAPVVGRPDAAAHAGAPGWGESDVDEAVDLLERAYAERARAREIGARGAATLAQLSWTRTAARLKEVILQTCAETGA